MGITTYSLGAVMEIGAIKTEDSAIDKWSKLSLTPLQSKQWMETRTALLVNQPAFADVWFRMMVDRDKELAWFTDEIPTAATNDRFMFINPQEFFKYKLIHRVFISCHEILHAIFNHCGAMYRFQKAGYILYPDGLKLPYDNDICQVSTDCLVNDTLIRGKVGEMPPDGSHGLARITYEDDITTAYRKLFEAWNGKGKKGVENYSKGKGNKSPDHGGKGFDKHLAPGQGTGKAPAQAEEQRNPQQWDNALSAALASAKAQGKLPLALERGLSKLLEPQIDWRDQLPVVVSRRLGTDFSTWDSLDNELMLRGIGAPSKARFGCGTVVFAVDTSGSINQKTMDMFNTEGVGLMEQARPRQLVYIQCDAQVHEYIELDSPEDMMRKLIGGGGTSFRPVFDRIEQEGLDPDVLIYLTDLEGTFPSLPPSYPVIWCTIRDHEVPFGDKVVLPKQLQE
jgi:predicted metal-dependent peptidase